MFYIQPVEILPALENNPKIADIRNAKLDKAGCPFPEIHLRGPPVISTTTELQGTLCIDLADPSNKYLKELKIKLEASVTTWSSSLQSSASASSHRQRKRLYIERHTLWRKADKKLTGDTHAFDFSFAMPPGYLPPSFRFNSQIYIQYRIRAVAVFEQGKRRTTFNLEHNPVQTLPEEHWAVLSAENWITIQSGSSKRHPQTSSQATAFSKLGNPQALKVTQSRKIGLRDKLRGRRLYPVRLNAMYPESGVFADSALDSVHIQLICDLLPLVQLQVRTTRVSLAVITEVSVNKRKYVDTKLMMLSRKTVYTKLAGDVAVDISHLFGTITIPSVAPTFHTKTLSRKYNLVLSCELVADDISSEALITLPLTILGNSCEAPLPVYQRDVDLPAYEDVA